MTKLELLVNLQGQKIVWAGFDQETDNYVVIFENGEALSLSAFERLEDVEAFRKGMLNQYGLEAKQIVALENLIKEEPSAE